MDNNFKQGQLFQSSVYQILMLKIENCTYLWIKFPGIEKSLAQ